jgi:hypothetical protein
VQEHRKGEGRCGWFCFFLASGMMHMCIGVGVRDARVYFVLFLFKSISSTSGPSTQTYASLLPPFPLGGYLSNGMTKGKLIYPDNYTSPRV